MKIFIMNLLLLLSSLPNKIPYILGLSAEAYPIASFAVSARLIKVERDFLCNKYEEKI